MVCKWLVRFLVIFRSVFLLCENALLIPLLSVSMSTLLRHLWMITLSDPNSIPTTLPSLLPPVPCSLLWHGTSGMMVVMMVVPLFLSSGYSWGFGHIHGGCSVIDNQFTPITLSASNVAVASTDRFIQCFLAPKWWVVWAFGLISSCCWFMLQVFPGLTVVTVESSPTLWAWWVKWCYRVTIWRSTMAVVFSAVVPAHKECDYKVYVKNHWTCISICI